MAGIYLSEAEKTFIVHGIKVRERREIEEDCPEDPRKELFDESSVYT